jgi:hypothetical protein
MLDVPVTSTHVSVPLSPGPLEARNRRWVVVAWILVIVGLFAGGKIAGGR